MTLRPLLLAAAVGALASASPAAAQADSVNYFSRTHSAALPTLLQQEDRFFYLSLFEAIEAQNWDRVELMLTQRPDGPLHGAALATYYLDPNSPRIDLSRIEDWLRRYPNNPQVEGIVRLGQTRGLSWMPDMPRERSLSRQPGITRRTLPSTIEDGSMPADVRAAILERIRNDDPDGARLLLDGVDASLSGQSRAEWRQRVAWSYYIENRDAEAYGMAQQVSQGSGPWVAEGDWVAGLAAWRLGDCARAGEFFNAASAGAHNPELKVAAHYWASRSLVRCREPQLAAAHLRSAARYDETLYGMLAAEQLGTDLPRDHTAPDFTQEDWRRLSGQLEVDDDYG